MCGNPDVVMLFAVILSFIWLFMPNRFVTPVLIAYSHVTPVDCAVIWSAPTKSIEKYLNLTMKDVNEPSYKLLASVLL